MKQIISALSLSVLLSSCNEGHKPKTWYLNEPHRGIVVDACYAYGYIKVIDSGNVYTCHVDNSLWNEIHNNDTIKHFGDK